MSEEKELTIFLLVREDLNWEAYWDPAEDSTLMFEHAKAAVEIYDIQPNTNYMITITRRFKHIPLIPHYLFQEVTDPTLEDLLKNKK